MRRLGYGVLLGLLGVARLAGAAPDLRMVEAAKRNDAPAVRALLTQHVAVNVAAADGATALLWASYYRDGDTVAALLAAGANPNLANLYQETPLSVACANGDTALVDRLLAGGAVPTVKPTGETLLMTAARAGRADLVQHLLARGVPVDARETTLGQTALMWATARQRGAVVEALLAAGADVNAASRSGSTALHFAVQQGDVATATRLLAAGANVHARLRVRQIDGFTLGLVDTLEALTPLLLAIADCRQDGLEYDGAASALVVHPVGQLCPASEDLGLLLLAHGADPNAPDGSHIPPLQQAVRAHMPRLVEALLAHGAVVNARVPDTTQQWPAHVLTGARAITPIPVGATAFWVAAWWHSPDLMRTLLAANADPRLPTADHTTPLMAAAGVSGRPSGSPRKPQPADIARMVDALKVALAVNDVNATNTEGQAALHGAARLGIDELTQALLAGGARTDLKDHHGDTPLAIAEAAKSVGTIDLLKGTASNASGRPSGR